MQPEHNPAPEPIMAEEETEVRTPAGTKKALPGFGGKDNLERTKNKEKECETKASWGEQYDHVYSRRLGIMANRIKVYRSWNLGMRTGQARQEAEASENLGEGELCAE